MKKNIISLVVLIVLAAAALYLVKKPSGNTAKIEKNMLAADSSLITSFELKDPDGKAELQRGVSGWIIEGDRKYPADNSAVNSMLGFSHNINLENIISENPGKHGRFGVDSSGTVITIKMKDNSVKTFIAGSDDMDRRHTFYRLPGSDHVYIGSLFPRYRIKTDPASWRDKNITGIDEKSLQKITFLKGNTTAEISRKDGVWHSSMNGKETVLSADDTDRIVKKLAALKAAGFTETAGTDDFQEPVTIIIIHDTGSDELILNGEKEKNEVYVREKQQGYTINPADKELLMKIFG